MLVNLIKFTVFFYNNTSFGGLIVTGISLKH